MDKIEKQVIEKSKRFIKVPLYLLECLNRTFPQNHPESKNIKFHERHLAALMLIWKYSFYGERPYYLSLKNNAKELGISVSKAQRNLKALEGFGLIWPSLYKVKCSNTEANETFTSISMAREFVRNNPGWHHSATEYTVMHIEKVVKMLTPTEPEQKEKKSKNPTDSKRNFKSENTKGFD